jgi:hypothetical protein
MRVRSRNVITTITKLLLCAPVCKPKIPLGPLVPEQRAAESPDKRRLQMAPGVLSNEQRATLKIDIDDISTTSLTMKDEW